MSVNYKIHSKAKARAKKPAGGAAASAAALELKEASADYFVRNVAVPEFFGQPINGQA